MARPRQWLAAADVARVRQWSRLRGRSTLLTPPPENRSRTAPARTGARVREAAASSKASERTRLRPSANASADGSTTSTPVSPSRTVSRGAAASERHDRAAAGLCLDRHHAEVFDAGQERRLRTAGTAHGFPRSTAIRGTSTSDPANAWRRARSGPVPTMVSGAPSAATGIDGDVQAFVGHQRRDDQEA